MRSWKTICARSIPVVFMIRNKIRKLYSELDYNRDGKVSNEEFCESYATKIDDFEMRILECKRKEAAVRSEISDLNIQKRDIAKTEMMNQFGIMEGSVLIATVIESRDLQPAFFGGGIDPFVVLNIEGQKIETSYRANTLNPIWNEWFTFDIKRGDDPLRVTVFDRGTFQNNFVGKLLINLESLESQQEIEEWHELHEDNYDSPERKGKIKLKLQWIFSRLQLIHNKVSDLMVFQKKIEDIRKAYERELTMIKSPFMFLFSDPTKFVEEDEPEILISIYQAHQKEHEISRKLDELVQPLKEKSTLGELFWSAAFVFAYLIYLLLTLLLWIHKPEFLNLAIWCVSSYLLPFMRLPGDLNSPRHKKKAIRIAVVLIFFSWIWDIVWLIFCFGDWWGELKYDGNIEQGLRRFWVVMTIISMVLRVIIFLIYWKLSLDYYRLTTELSDTGLMLANEKQVYMRNVSR